MYFDERVSPHRNRTIVQRNTNARQLLENTFSCIENRQPDDSCAHIQSQLCRLLSILLRPFIILIDRDRLRVNVRRCGDQQRGTRTSWDWNWEIKTTRIGSNPMAAVCVRAYCFARRECAYGMQRGRPYATQFEWWRWCWRRWATSWLVFGRATCKNSHRVCIRKVKFHMHVCVCI